MTPQAEKLCALPRGSKILVTGANGFIGSHVVNCLLELGYIVHGTVRSPKPWLDEFFASIYGPGAFKAVTVPDFDHVELLAREMEGIVDASDLTFGNDPNAVIPWVVRATQNILEAAAKTPSVKRVVLTSSSTAALTPIPNHRVRVDENTWNDDAVKAAWEQNPDDERLGLNVYSASKTEGERQAWKWIKDNNPGFDFNAVGKILHSQIGGSTAAYVRGLWFVDVVDTARLHVIALLNPDLKSQRIFAFAAPFQLQDFVNILRMLRPGAQIPDARVNEGVDLSEIVPSADAENLLKTIYGQEGWTTLEDSLARTIEDI
ncbi:hypothetical protein BDV26DRAFT_278373 [Aspergillus bertholletiae]|uniref:NAD-dependent epimerase/dehydratase domain-containing protein n=1 Tax=Aspergillus bertholletiae TaxID=1226010 RepID=A0A5N7BJL5_9EURO|nr:hypothetical protein BDV26DRAFT_278373 [Aspergillus bertholletiae]